MKLSDRRTTVHRPRVSPRPNPEKIAHVPARVNHDPIPFDRNTARRPRVSPSPNTKKMAHVPARKEPVGKQKAAETQIPKPLTYFPRGTFIYKLFDKKYWQATILGFDTHKGYYTVQYDDNDEEELTPEEVESYPIPPEKG